MFDGKRDRLHFSFRIKKRKPFCAEAATGGCSLQKVVLKNFAIFTGKHMCWSLLISFILSVNFSLVLLVKKHVLRNL